MKKFLTVLRLKEIVGKTGFFIIGALFALPSISYSSFYITVQFFGLCLLNGISVYLINAGFGYEQDITNDRLQYFQKFRKSTILVAGFSLFFISLILLYLFNPKLLLPALMVYSIWIVYSLPKGLKGIPILGIICAFAAQLIHFHVGYLVFSSWSSESMLLSVYFALLFSGGHALHEVIDFEADKQAGLQTSAVAFGKKNLFYISNFIFAIGTLYFVVLMVEGILPLYWVMPYFFAFAVQFWFFIELPRDWRKENLFVYRRKYMTAYLVATVAVMLMMYL